jgi:hypothetical protein
MYNATDQIASGANLADTSTASLANATQKFPLGLIVRGMDQALGGGEFMYVLFNGTVAAGDVCQISDALVANTIQYQAVDWAGTANKSFALGVALAPQVAASFGWVQIQGNAVVNTSGAVAIGDNAWFQAAGVVSSTLVAGKQALGMSCASLNNATISGYGALGAQKAVYLLNRPFAQGNIT